MVIASNDKVHYIGPSDMILYDKPSYLRFTISEERNVSGHDVSVFPLHSLLVLLPIVHTQSPIVVALGLRILSYNGK